MRKLITLFIIGVLGIIAILMLKKALTGDGSISLICKNGQDTITLKFDPTSDTAISAKRQDGSDYVVEGIDEKIEKVGVMRFIEDFTHDFEIHKGGTCFKRQVFTFTLTFIFILQFYFAVLLFRFFTLATFSDGIIQ